MIDYEKAFNKAVEYLENDCGCCPACYDCEKFEREKCMPCISGIIDNRNEDYYNKELSIKCWKDIFIEMSKESEV